MQQTTTNWVTVLSKKIIKWSILKREIPNPKLWCDLTNVINKLTEKFNETCLKLVSIINHVLVGSVCSHTGISVYSKAQLNASAAVSISTQHVLYCGLSCSWSLAHSWKSTTFSNFYRIFRGYFHRKCKLLWNRLFSRNSAIFIELRMCQFWHNSFIDFKTT